MFLPMINKSNRRFLKFFLNRYNKSIIWFPVTGYLHYKTIFYHTVALDMLKKTFRSRDIQILVYFWNSQIEKYLWRHLRHYYIMEVTYFFWIPSPIKMKLGEILVWFKTTISNMFLAQCRRLETSSRPFHDFIKVTI